MYLTNNKSFTSSIRDKIGYVLLFFISFYLLSISPQILAQSQPDSSDYLFGSSTRKHLYTLVIIFCKKINFELILFQKIFFTSSLVFLFYALNKKFGMLFTIFFIILIFSNFYYTTFSKTILAESIFFSFINFSIGLIFLEKFFVAYLFLGFFSGCIISTKSIGPVIAIPFIIFAIIEIYIKTKKNFFFLILLFIITSMIVPTIEHYKYFSEQQERKTVFSHSVLGKVFLISGYKSFKIENYPKNLSQMLQLSKKKFEEVHFFLDKIKNPILKADLMADYEAVAQYQMVYFFSDEDKSKYEHIKKKPMKLFLDLIANNPFEYINISLSHYIGLWSTGSKFIFLEKFLSKNNDINQPMKNEFDNSSGPMKSIDTKLLMVTQIFFIILFANIILLTVYFGFRLLMGKKINPIFFFLLILLQTYLALVSLTNIATIRYLMPLYPSIIILFLYSIKSLFLTFVNKG